MSIPVAPRRKAVWRSLLGAGLAALYASAFAAAYIDYLNKAGQWLADLPLMLVALPFTSAMNALSGGEFSMSGDQTFKVAAAAAFCCALVYAIGATAERFARALIRLAIRRPGR